MADKQLPRLVRAGKILESVPLSRAQLFKLAANDGIPHYRVGRTVLFDPVEVATWLEKRRNVRGQA